MCRFNELTDSSIWGRTKAIYEILEGLGMFCPEKMIHHRYFMKYLRDHTEQMNYLVVVVS